MDDKLAGPGAVQTMVAFGLTGLLVGLLAGTTSAAVTAPLIALVFAAFGGSVSLFLSRLSVVQQSRALLALAGLSGGCIVGLVLGFVVTEHQLLTPPALRSDSQRREDRTLIRSTEIDAFERRWRNAGSLGEKADALLQDVFEALREEQE